MPNLSMLEYNWNLKKLSAWAFIPNDNILKILCEIKAVQVKAERIHHQDTCIRNVTGRFSDWSKVQSERNLDL